MLVVECGAVHSAERRYVLDVMLGEFLGLEYELRSRSGQRDVVISSIDPADTRRLVVADVLFADNAELLVEAALPAAPLSRSPSAAVGGDLPLLYARPLPSGAYVEESNEGVAVGIDLFGGVFLLLTRLEEAVLPDRDAHGRFPASASLAVRSGFADRPLADEYVEVLWWAIERLWPQLERKGRTFTTRPTHDVDWPFYSRGKPFETLRQSIADLSRRHDRSLAASRIRAFAAVARSGRDADPCNTFEFLMRASEDHGLRSSFFFMAGATDPARDAGYPFDSWLRTVIRTIDARGHELGLHPSYNTFRDEHALQREVQALRTALAEERVEHELIGGRQHFLRWENPVTWRNWDRMGLREDSTLGYAELCGFRCGTCHAYPVFDLEERRRLALRERPLLAMEAALLNYQQKTLDETVEAMRELKAVCRRFGGTFTFLWHNNRLSTPAEREAYARVLD